MASRGAKPHAYCRFTSYVKSESTAPDDPFAWANAARPLWFRILKRVSCADSVAMFASRIRLSAARLLTTWFLVRLMAKFNRFWIDPTAPCT